MTRNNYFEFKQFAIYQQKASMKVGTDGVLLGAWAGHGSPKTILDIGTGTGVVALMLAQRFPDARITAVDIDGAAYSDAADNFARSKWGNRVEAILSSFQEFGKTHLQPFDMLVCNPPYFSNAVKSGDDGRNLARHDDSLPFEELLQSASCMMNENSTFSLVMPLSEERRVRAVAADVRLFARRLVRVKPKPSKPASRLLIEFQREALLVSEEELTIETETHHYYTPGFEAMVKDFYLKL